MSKHDAPRRALKLSQFNFVVRVDEVMVLHNTWSGGIVTFSASPEELTAMLARLTSANTLSDADAAARDALLGQRMLVDAEANEGAEYQAWMRQRIVERTDVLQLTFVATMRCNLQCPYCYENGLKDHGRASDDTAAATAHFIAQQIDTTGTRNVDLTILGGEATMHPELCEAVLREVAACCVARGVEFRAGLVTNGTLPLLAMVEALVPHGLRWVKVTLDGDREGHDAHRALPNGTGTWDTVFANAEAIAPLVELIIGGNFAPHTAAGFHTLIDRLAAAGFRDRITLVRFKPVQPIIPPSQLVRRGRVSGACVSPSYTSESVTTMLALDEHLVAVNLPIQPRIDLGPCEATQRHSLTIGPDGSLYKCAAFVGNGDFVVGNVREGVRSELVDAQLDAITALDDACLKCKHLPTCAGGCRYTSYQRTGRLDPKTCDVEYLSRALTPNLIRQLNAQQ